MFKNKLVCLKRLSKKSRQPLFYSGRYRRAILKYTNYGGVEILFRHPLFYCPESLVDPILVIQALFFSHLMAIIKNNGTVAIAKPLFFASYR